MARNQNFALNTKRSIQDYVICNNTPKKKIAFSGRDGINEEKIFFTRFLNCKCTITPLHTIVVKVGY